MHPGIFLALLSDRLKSKSLVVFSLLAVCFSSPIGFSQTLQKQQAPDIIALELNKPIEREIAGEQKHRYQITLSANQYARVTIEQQSADITAQIFAANGQLIAAIDSESFARGAEKIELVAEISGNHRIEIKPSLPKARGGKYVIRLSESREATANERSLDEARRKFYESLRLNDDGNFDRALELASEALAIREKIPGADHTETAASMLLVSRLSLTKNNLAQAESFAQQAIKTIAKASGADSLSSADALTALGRIRLAQANYAEAEMLYRQALDIRRKAAGADSVPVAVSLHQLALLYRAMNDYPKAEENFTTALSLNEKLLGENHFQTALALNNFGLFYYGAGDFDKALNFMQRSLAAKERLFPPNHREIGISFNNLGLIAWKKRDYEKAKAYYLRALSIFEIVNGPESDGVANILGNLGIIYKESDGNLAKAEEYYKRSLAITEKIFGEYHQNTAFGATSLAILYRSAGDLERAEQFQLRAQAIYERVLGEYNHYSILSLGNLVRIYAAQGDVKRAVEHLKRLVKIHEKVIPLNLRIGSERQKIAYYKQTARFDNIITLHAELARSDESMRDLAVTTILQHKGRVLDAVSDSLSALRRRFDPEDRKLLDNLSDVNARLSKVILSNRQKVSAEEQEKQVKALEAERDRLESEISRRSAGFYEPSQPVTLGAVRALIPADAALVEYAVYRPFKWKAGEREPNYGEPRYIAYIVRREGTAQWTDLGEAEAIDAAIDEFRKALRDPKRADTQKLARAVDEKIMQPVRKLSGDAAHLLVSPDGELNLIPFEALVDEKRRYLIENYSFAYLTSGRDLLRMQRARASKGKSLIVANPAFGEPITTEQITKVAPTDAKTNSPQRKNMTATRNIFDTYFAPLGGTITEARSIQALFPEASLLTGAQATEAALKQFTAPLVLHVATHGFFLENTDEIKSADSTGNSNSKMSDETENPLLRSGLALAGANRRGSAAGGDDGMLTALEASGLNLWGTKLVVLSACDTGLGEVKNGEGVYGLRRAFVLAGTESLVMSLWPVSDYTTRELMSGYYKNLKQGLGRGDSLRRIQLEMLRGKDRRHPFYWAAFIQSGEWANLDGRR